MVDPQLFRDEDLSPPPPPIPRSYPRSQCKRCPRRVAWATLVNAMDEPIRRQGTTQVVRIPLDLFTVKNGPLRLVAGERVREVSAGELYLGDRFQRHKCTRKRATR